MEQKLRNSWQLIKACGNVLRSDKELLVFPVISSILVLAISVFFALPIFRDLETSGRPTYPLLFVYYFIIYTVIILLNSALIGAAMIRLKGGNPTIMDGIKIASNHLPSILGYALISSTIGILLGWLQEKLGLFGKIFAFLSNFAWNIVTFLVIPILVVEGVGPVDAIKRSAALLKKTWGEQVIGNIGIGFFFGLIAAGLMILFLPFAIYSSLHRMHSITILLGVIFGLAVLILAVIGSAMSSIYTAALYRYAAEGVIGENFDENIMRDSFRKK